MEKSKSGFFHRFRGGKEPGKSPGGSGAPEPSVSWPKKATVLSLRLSPRIGDCKARYVFKDLEAAFDSNAYEPGIPVLPQADGSILVGGKPAGKFSNPKIQAMLRDWHELGDPVTAHLLQMNQDGTGSVYLVFYKSPVYDHERFCKVFGTGSSDKQEELLSLAPGNDLYLVEDVDVPGRVDVSEIGYLEQKDSAWALDTLDFAVCEVTVASVEADENGTRSLSVRIRY